LPNLVPDGDGRRHRARPPDSSSRRRASALRRPFPTAAAGAPTPQVPSIPLLGAVAQAPRRSSNFISAAPFLSPFRIHRLQLSDEFLLRRCVPPRSCSLPPSYCSVLLTVACSGQGRTTKVVRFDYRADRQNIAISRLVVCSVPLPVGSTR